MANQGAPAVLRIGKDEIVYQRLGRTFDTVFLFGAGASHGCGKVTPHAPPLGDKIFQHLCAAFPDTWGALPAALMRQFEVNFELGMDRLWKTNDSGTSALLLKQMGIYLSQFAPADQQGTLYRKLASRLADCAATDVLLSTLNYDCLLDGDLVSAGFNVNYLFGKAVGMPLMKLHGSCNWVINVPGMNRYVNFTSDIRFEAQPTVLNCCLDVAESLSGDTPFHPVFCLYTEGKPAPLCPSLFEHLQCEWEKQILSARKIAIIGVSPNPADKHIWGPLTATSAKLICIGRGYEEWHRDSGRMGDTIVLNEFFEEGFDALWDSIFPTTHEIPKR